MALLLYLWLHHWSADFILAKVTNNCSGQVVWYLFSITL